ncbi:MAG: very short patch repair endonuclease [Mucilaginibacter sp.]|nr:very short patch repair endonuclease [Mucilaginibacter sp.]
MISKHGFETTVARSLLMSKIKSNNTKAEVLLRKSVWKLGYRYRIHISTLPGKPDIVFKSKKIVIFIDGEFWHGYKWDEKKTKIKSNKDYWIKKIERNIERDIQNQRTLSKMGYVVIRFWEHEVKKELETCLKKILDILKEK